MSTPTSQADVFELAANGQLNDLRTLGRIHLEGKNDRGWTPLMFAARYGHAEIVEYLLTEQKVDAKAVNKEGKTAQDLAEFWGSAQVVTVFDRLFPKPKVSVQLSGQEPTRTGLADWWKRKTVHEVKPSHFTGSILNRVSFLRTDKDFLNASIRAKSTQILLLEGHGVLFKSTTKDLAFVQYRDVQDILGPDPLDNLPEGLTLVFLGIDETNIHKQDQDHELVHGRRGNSYWALDIAGSGASLELKQQLKELSTGLTDSFGHYFAEARPASFGLALQESGLLAQARAVVDWNKRTQFCAACGRKNKSLEGGHKRSCPPVNEADGSTSTCLAHKGVQNFTYPRTDPVVIVCVISQSGDKCLMGRQAIWPKGMYSCLAGFVEPGESLEEAARREVREESGVRVGHVMYHSSQPWPFPNSLMIGCLAEAVNEEINVTLEDRELEDAKWFTRKEVLEALNGSKSSTWGVPTEGNVLRLPPATAIAHQILKAWAAEEGDIPQSKM